MNDWVDRLGKGVGFFLVLLIALLVCLTLFQVFIRYALNSPDPYTEELSRTILMWFGVLSGAYCVYKHSHVGITILVDKLEPLSVVKVETLVRYILFTFNLIVLIYGGVKLVLICAELQQFTPVLNLPLAFIYLVLPVAGLFIALFLLFPSYGASERLTQ